MAVVLMGGGEYRVSRKMRLLAYRKISELQRKISKITQGFLERIYCDPVGKHKWKELILTRQKGRQVKLLLGLIAHHQEPVAYVELSFPIMGESLEREEFWFCGRRRGPAGHSRHSQ